MADFGRWAAGIASGGLSEAGRGFKKGIDKIREKQRPEQQYWGGSQYEYATQQGAAKQGVVDADQQAVSSVGRAESAADDAATSYGRLENALGSYGYNQEINATRADAGFGRSMGDYQSGRAGVLTNAERIEAAAGRLGSDYQQTAERQFQLNQARAANAAQSLAARGGPAALRAAMASQIQASADAAAQAEITRAQEFNELADRRLGAYATAAGIRSGLGSQDQAAGQIYAGRQQNAYANLAGANAQLAGVIGDRYAAQQGAAQLGAGTAVAQQGNRLGALTAMETAQLNAEREREQQRQDAGNRQFNRWRDPLGMHGGG